MKARPLSREGDGSDAAIRERLRSICAHLTYADLARASGVSTETVRRYQQSGTPSIAYVVAIARTTQTSLEWLLTGEGPPSEEVRQLWSLSRYSTHDLCMELTRRIETVELRTTELRQRLEQLLMSQTALGLSRAGISESSVAHDATE